MSNRLVVLTLALLSTLPIVASGTPQQPEIRDATREVNVNEITILTPETDIVSAWFDSNATSLGVSLEVLDLSHRFRSDEWFQMWVDFECGSDHVGVEFEIAPPPPLRPLVVVDSFSRINGSYRFISPPFAIDGNIMHTDVPRTFLDCTQITRTFAGASTQFPPATGLISSIGRDFAPGYGHAGDDYTMT